MKGVFIVPENKILTQGKQNLYQWDSMWEYKARKRLWLVPHLGLLTVAALMPENYSISYIDMNYTDKIEGDYDWAFLSPSTCQAVQAYVIADDVRRRGIRVAMGGLHASLLPDEALKHSDTVFIGEAEDIMGEFIQDVSSGNVKRLYKSSEYTDMKKSPLPRYDLVRKYPYKSFPVQTSRGCPHQCSFCISSKVYGKKVRRKTIEQIRRELNALLMVNSKPLIFFTDDNLFLDPKFSEALLGLIKCYDLRWYAFSDVNIAYNDELLERIAGSGCMQLLIGFESLSADNLGDINQSKWKMSKLEHYKNIVENIQRHGVGVVGSFILGLDGDNTGAFEQVYDFILDTRIYATNLTVLTPFPGTDTYESLKSQNRIFAKDWSSYNGFELTYTPQSMSVEEFEAGYRELYSKINSPERTNKVIEHFKNIYKSLDKRTTSGRPNHQAI